MKLYVIRHGESQSNFCGTWTGWKDVPLTEKGRAQARQVGKLLADIPFDRVYASDLSRAVDTAREALPGREIVTSPRLRETNVGNLMGRPYDCLTPEERAQTALEGFSAFDGESRVEFYGRIREFLTELEGAGLEHVAVFSHGGWIKGALNTVLETTLQAKHLRCGNCTLGIFEYTGGIWALHSWINL